MSHRIWKLALPLFAAAVLPATAFADDETVGGSAAATSSPGYQDCVDKCLQDANNTSAATTQTVKKAKAKRAKKATSGTVAQAPTTTSPSSSEGTGVAGNLDAVKTPEINQATIDSIRAEERARAAEEFNAEHQRSMAGHDAEIERAKAEARAQAESESAQQLANERMRYEQSLADARKDDEKVKDALVTPAGVYGFLGGGATNFTQPSAVGSTDAGGYWDARLGIGTRSVLGAEVGYVGSARDIDALGAGGDAFLMSNGIEGVARLNVPITPGEGKVLIEPYTFAGIGWQRFNVVSEASFSADLSNEDDIMTVPLGLGMAFGFSGLTLDVRGTYRQAIGSDLFGNETSSFGETSLNSWAAGAALGFEF